MALQTGMSKQYLDSKEIQSSIGKISLSTFKLLSTDSYNETAILEAIKKTGMVAELACAALQTSIIGFGNKTYGSFNYKGIDIDVKTLYTQCSVKWNLSISTKLDESELTPRRLQRFFRYHIKNFLSTNPDVKPYLWKKYSNHDESYRNITYPGSEHAIEEMDEAIFLVKTYNNLDRLCNTNITDRILRVFAARGLEIKLSSIENWW